MPRPLPLDVRSVEFQVAVRDLRLEHGAPLYEAALRTGDWTQVSDAHLIARHLDAAIAIARRMARRASAPELEVPAQLAAGL